MSDLLEILFHTLQWVVLCKICLANKKTAYKEKPFYKLLSSTKFIQQIWLSKWNSSPQATCHLRETATEENTDPVVQSIPDG